MTGAVFGVQGFPLQQSLPALAAWLAGRRVAPAVVAVRRRRSTRPAPVVGAPTLAPAGTVPHEPPWRQRAGGPAPIGDPDQLARR